MSWVLVLVALVNEAGYIYAENEVQGLYPSMNECFEARDYLVKSINIKPGIGYQALCIGLENDLEPLDK